MQAKTAEQGSTRDDREIARFNALARDWWNPRGSMKPLHRMNPVRLSFLRRELGEGFGRNARAMRAFEGLSLLDIGCGAGLLAEPLARMGFAVTGIDLAEDAITAARDHAEAGGLVIDYRVVALESLPETPAFDVITLLEVIEHVPEPARLIAEAAKRLKPGGMLFVSTLNRTLKSHALAIIGAEYILRWLPIGTHDWNRFVTPAEVEDAFLAAGLEPGRSEGMVYNPLFAEWSLSGDRDVNFISAARKQA
jgi:2-polyprenyl-6-hydroxyphenyl methylase / 3-demethylubiquinone-9 3-methyltransferase